MCQDGGYRVEQTLAAILFWDFGGLARWLKAHHCSYRVAPSPDVEEIHDSELCMALALNCKWNISYSSRFNGALAGVLTQLFSDPAS